MRELIKKPKPRPFKIGDLYSAEFTDYSGKVTTGIYTFKLLHKERYLCEKTFCWRECFLGVKLFIERRPENQEHSQCWWFDDQGRCYDSAGEFSFLLTRRKKLKSNP